MSTMVMALRVVVPPHPLIGHWLGVLRDRHTPAALYATATNELGRWLSYEALRDWLPHRRVDLDTPLGSAHADLVDATVPLVALPLLTAGLGLWQGAQSVLPSARVVHLWEQQGEISGLDSSIDPRAGVLLFCAELSDGERLIRVLDRLAELGVGGDRLRVVTALASAPGLQSLGERHGHLTLYTAAIDPELNALGQIVPGIGVVKERLFAGTVLESAAGVA
jgi:uracil phosphoribosyltransferase